MSFKRIPREKWIWGGIGVVAATTTIFLIQAYVTESFGPLDPGRSNEPHASPKTTILKPTLSSRSPLYLIIAALVAELILVYAYIQVFESNSFIIPYTVMKILTIGLVVIGGIWFFGERLTKLQWLGVGLAVLAIIILAI